MSVLYGSHIKDFNSTFEDLLEMDTSVTIHQRNLQQMALEIFKTKECINPPFMQEILYQTRRSNKNTRGSCVLPKVRTCVYGTESLRFRAPKIWKLVPEDAKKLQSLGDFKRVIKSWKPAGCSCRICHTFIPNLGYLWGFVWICSFSFFFSFLLVDKHKYCVILYAWFLLAVIVTILVLWQLLVWK